MHHSAADATLQRTRLGSFHIRNASLRTEVGNPASPPRSNRHTPSLGQVLNRRIRLLINIRDRWQSPQYSRIAVALSRQPNIPAPPPDTAFLCHSTLMSASAPVMWIWCALLTRACHVLLVNALDFSGICRRSMHRWIQSERTERPTCKK